MFGIVIDRQGFKVEFVHLLESGVIDSYILKDEESVIETDWKVANSMNKPQWNGTEWIDTEPLPPVEPPVQEEDKMETLTAELSGLEIKVMKLERGLI